MSLLHVRSLTRRSPPGLPFRKAARDLLPAWELSLVFVDARFARRINQKTRGKTYVPNVLAFPLGKKSGEIFICSDVVKKEAPAYHLSERDYALFLFIHALLHLKGMRHGTTMERTERTLLNRYLGRESLRTTNGPTHRNRHRHRHLPG